MDASAIVVQTAGRLIRVNRALHSRLQHNKIACGGDNFALSKYGVEECTYADAHDAWWRLELSLLSSRRTVCCHGDAPQHHLIYEAADPVFVKYAPSLCLVSAC